MNAPRQNPAFRSVIELADFSTLRLRWAPFDPFSFSVTSVPLWQSVSVFSVALRVLCVNSFFCFVSASVFVFLCPSNALILCLAPHMSINTLIVDDEKPARDELAFLLKAFPEINLVAQGKNGLEAVNLIKEHSPDLVFLDVQMPGLDGFGVLKKLVERKARVPHVVFATAFDHYAVQAFDVNAVDYVLKPFDKSRIAKAIARARREMEADTSPAERLEKLVNQLAAPKPTASSAPVKLLVKSQQRLLLVDAEDLVFAT